MPSKSNASARIVPSEKKAILQLNHPVEVNGQRASALRFTDRRVLAQQLAVLTERILKTHR